VALFTCSAPAEGRVAGKRFTIAGVECYLVEPRDRATFRDQALILIPDATGISNPEIRLLAGASHYMALSHGAAHQVSFTLDVSLLPPRMRASAVMLAGVTALPRQRLYMLSAEVAAKLILSLCKPSSQCACAVADRYATEGNFLVVLPDIIDKGDVRACPPPPLPCGATVAPVCM